MSKRKSFLINPKFQINLISKVFVLALANNLVFFSAIYYFFIDLKETALNIGLPKKHIFFTFLELEYHDILWPILLASILSLVLVLIVIFGVLISHKIAGPLHQLSQALVSMTEGGSAREISFRKGDYFQDLNETVNHFIYKKIITSEVQTSNDHE